MKHHRNHIDFLTLVAVVTLMMLSLGIVYSASAMISKLRAGDSEHFLQNHAIKVAIGLVGMFIAMRFDYKKLQRLTKPLLMGAVGMLFITLVVGVVAKGASRWIQYGGFGFQPSEFAKYALLFHLCTLIATKGELIRDFKKGLVPMLFWIGAVTGLVMLQPNFSMGTMIMLLSVVMLYVGRANLSHLTLLFLAMLPVLAAYMMWAPYRRARVMAFLGGVDTTGKAGNYQVNQGIIAFGSGGIFGVGPGESKQRDFFLPESYGDFVFSIVGEEYGLLGTLFFMALFLLIMYRGLKIARFAPDVFGRNLAIAITCAVTFYALINAGVNLGIFPTTGLPMPFVSYGGSSMVLSAVAVGVLLNISSQTDMHPRARQVPVVGSVNAGEATVGKVY
jgi:cell division protein FtsW